MSNEIPKNNLSSKLAENDKIKSTAGISGRVYYFFPGIYFISMAIAFCLPPLIGKPVEQAIYPLRNLYDMAGIAILACNDLFLEEIFQENIYSHLPAFQNNADCNFYY